MRKTDVLIIGAGVVGTGIARELAKTRLNVLVVDKNSDVGGEASRACSAIVGPGFTDTPGSFACTLSHAAMSMFETLCRDLDIPALLCGQIMTAVTDEQYASLFPRLEMAFENGDYDIELMLKKDILRLEPALSPEVRGGLYSPRHRSIDPFNMVVAMAENAAENGVEFLTGAEVTGMELKGGRIARVHTTSGEIEAGVVINAAGLYCDEIARMAGDSDFVVKPRKGEFFILDKNTPVRVSHIIAPVPTAQTRGKYMLPTAHGNMLVGPTAFDMEDKTDKRVRAEGLAEIEADIRALVPGVVLRDAITEFAGLRPNRIPEGYHIGFSDVTKNYLGISGVRSDGVSTCPAIAVWVVRLLRDYGLDTSPRAGFVRRRRGIASFAGADNARREALIAADPLYANVICRCETITEGEIVQAIHRGAHTVDGVKRRLRAGMGRCQGGFCGPKVIEILARELGLPPEAIEKDAPGSGLVQRAAR